MPDSYFDAIGSSIVTAMSAGSTLLSVVTYVLTALGLYTMASRRGIRKPWLAWIPMVDVWILGSLSDQYRYVVRGENRSKRKWLLGLSIAGAGISVVVIGLFGSVIVSAVFSAMQNVPESYMVDMLMGRVVTMVLLLIPMLGVSIAKVVLYYMSLYDVYTSCDPQNNVLFLVLSIFFGITKPFFLFLNREKDLGMPNRRQDPPPQPNPQPWNEQTTLLSQTDPQPWNEQTTILSQTDPQPWNEETTLLSEQDSEP